MQKLRRNDQVRVRNAVITIGLRIFCRITCLDPYLPTKAVLISYQSVASNSQSFPLAREESAEMDRDVGTPTKALAEIC